MFYFTFFCSKLKKYKRLKLVNKHVKGFLPMTSYNNKTSCQSLNLKYCFRKASNSIFRLFLTRVSGKFSPPFKKTTCMFSHKLWKYHKLRSKAIHVDQKSQKMLCFYLFGYIHTWEFQIQIANSQKCFFF